VIARLGAVDTRGVTALAVDLADVHAARFRRRLG